LTVASVFDEICNRQLVLKSNKKKSTYSRSLLLKGADRAELEKQERSKWALVLAGWIVEANLPIVPAIEATQNPAKAWVQIFGARRPKSLRNRARTWGAMRAWLALACEVTFPTAVHHMLDYWNSRGEGLLGNGLGGTWMPGTILAALMPMEAMGQIDQSAMICRNSATVGVVNNWTMLLTQNHTTVRKANLPTLSLVMALELWFTNAEASLFMLSWTWLMPFEVLVRASLRLPQRAGSGKSNIDFRVSDTHTLPEQNHRARQTHYRSASVCSSPLSVDRSGLASRRLQDMDLADIFGAQRLLLSDC
jgi:hypothetical protein